VLDPENLADLTLIVAFAEYLADAHSTDGARGLLADELVSMIERGVLTVEVRNGIHDGRADTYLAVTMNGELRTVSVSELDLPDDIRFEWP
jgi:hypothetical protein